MTSYAFFMCTADGLPSLTDIAARFGVSADDLDPHFGVVPIQPLDLGQWRVAFRVDERLVPGLDGTDQLDGPFSDPSIEPQ
ncbi:hypothetical protein [Nocardioides stalactiti]|uniref:hypothetical protein n=1 Tax=Nocardioides stalactiti TaxID=2755356 RepID=UPI0016041013|nr:hypothetical protein [Nocardioides stalactiti]